MTLHEHVCYWLFPEYGWDAQGSPYIEVARELGVRPHSPYQEVMTHLIPKGIQI